MSELHDILERYREERTKGTRVVHLATLLATEGSTYRRPGARTLFVADGSPRGYATIGLVSGGCVEGDLALRRGDAPGRAVHTYDLDAEGDALFGLGIGCKGKLWIALERVAIGSADDVLALLEGAVAREGGPGFLVHALAGDRGPSWSPSLEEALRCARGGGAFVEALPRQVDLALFGAGPDTAPLLGMARTMGWRATVTDHRPALLADLPFSTHACPVAHLRAAASRTSADAVVVMTHHLEADGEVLRGLAQAIVSHGARPRYVGLLGPRRRRDELLARLTDGERAALSPVLHGPCGLDLGGDGPEAVALAITAEIQASLSGRSAARLRTRDAAIHDDRRGPLLGVVLAAGESRRFGGPKALAELGGCSLLARAIHTLREAGVDDVAVIVGARAEAVAAEASSHDACAVTNERWALGMTSSLRVAAAEARARGARAMLVLPVDQPAVTSDHLVALERTFARGASLVASEYEGTLGIPALFGSRHYGEVTRLGDTERGKDLLERHRGGALALVPLPRGARDVDTREDLDAYREARA